MGEIPDGYLSQAALRRGRGHRSVPHSHPHHNRLFRLPVQHENPAPTPGGRRSGMSAPEAGPPPFILTLIPAAQEFNNEYELAIVPACKAAGAYIERADGRI